MPPFKTLDEEVKHWLGQWPTKTKAIWRPRWQGEAFDACGADRGYVFCARVADHAQPQFRYLACSPDEEPLVVGETLTCIAHARPDQGPDTPRVLSEETLHLAYDAWARAKEDIVGRWNEASDPRALAPEVPKAMRDAAELIRAARPGGWTQEQADALVEKLEEAYPERTQRQIREAMRSSEDPAEQAAAIAAKVEELGLEPSPPPEPLPPITDDDVHLVCWLAITPEGETDGATGR